MDNNNHIIFDWFIPFYDVQVLISLALFLAVTAAAPQFLGRGFGGGFNNGFGGGFNNGFGGPGLVGLRPIGGFGGFGNSPSSFFAFPYQFCNFLR